MSNTQSPLAERIPDNAPTVAVDINVGKNHEYIGFDYEEFSKEAKRMGIPTDKEMNELSINISEKLPHDNLGAYRGDEKSIALKAHNEINKTLAHELSHYKDYTESGRERPDARYTFGKIGLQLGKVAMVGQLVALSYVGYKSGEFIDDPSQMAEAGKLMAVASSTGLATNTAAYYGYNKHPDEVRARKAEEETENQTLQLVEKDKKSNDNISPATTDWQWSEGVPDSGVLKSRQNN